MCDFVDGLSPPQPSSRVQNVESWYSTQYYNGTISNIKISFNNSVAIWLWNAAFVDLAISISLLITLKQRIGGLNVPADSLLWKLIVVSLQTAAYTSVLATAGGKLLPSLRFLD